MSLNCEHRSDKGLLFTVNTGGAFNPRRFTAASSLWLLLTATAVAQPIIITHPVIQSGFAGTNVSLLVAINATPPVAYQWQFNGNNLPGATNISLTLTN